MTTTETHGGRWVGREVRILSVPLDSQQDLIGAVGTCVNWNNDGGLLLSIRLADGTHAWLPPDSLERREAE